MLYADSFKGSEIPQTSSPMNLSFDTRGRNLATFQPAFTGKLDHYKAQFYDGFLLMEVFTPSTALSNKLVYPDFSAFTGFSSFNTSSMKLTSIEAYHYDGFAENKLPYKDWHSYHLNGKSLSKSY